MVRDLFRPLRFVQAPLVHLGDPVLTTYNTSDSTVVLNHSKNESSLYLSEYIGVLYVPQ